MDDTHVFHGNGLATAAPALAQATWTYSDIDQDGNLELSSAEFERFGRDLFVTWDANTDQVVDEDEFYVGVYNAWDVDDDDILTDAEYSEGWGTWFGDYDEVGYGDLDLDADAELTEDEFATGLGEARLYDTWADGGDLGEEQFVTGLYDVYDADDDLVVTQAEYDVVGEFWTVLRRGGHARGRGDIAFRLELRRPLCRWHQRRRRHRRDGGLWRDRR